MSETSPARRKLPSLEQCAEVLEKDIANLPAVEQEAAREAARRVLGRRRPHKPGLRQTEEGGFKVEPEFDSPVAHAFRSRDVFGTASGDFAHSMLTTLANCATLNNGSKLDEAELTALVAAVEGVRPENEVEAMLAVQMATTHSAAMRMLYRAGAAGQPEAAQGYGSLAVKLLRTYTTQIEALAKVRRKGEQTVRVEHVHVYPGGQAIVGHVAPRVAGGGDRGQLENGHQPHGTDDVRTLALAGGAPLRSEDEGGHAVPVTGGRGKEAVPDARGRGRKRVAGRA